MQTLSQPKIQRAKKQYPCDGVCGGTIEPRERYAKAFAYGGYGHIETLRYCWRCTPRLDTQPKEV